MTACGFCRGPFIVKDEKQKEGIRPPVLSENDFCSIINLLYCIFGSLYGIEKTGSMLWIVLGKALGCELK